MKMEMIKKTTVFAVLMAMLLCGAYAWAEEEAPSGGADIALLSQYVWRGYAFSDSSIVIQPSISAGYKGFGLNLWGNLDIDYYDTGKDFNYKLMAPYSSETSANITPLTTMI